MPTSTTAVHAARWSIPFAITFELWRVAGWWLLAVPLLNFSWLAAVYALLSYVGVRDFRGTEHGAWLHMAMLGVLCMAACAMGVPLIATTKPEWRHTRPVSAMTWLTCELFNCVTAGLLIYILMAGAVNLIFDAGWSFLAPCLLIIAAVSIGMMVRCMFERSPFLQVMVGGACWIATMCWLSTRFGFWVVGWSGRIEPQLAAFRKLDVVHSWSVPSLPDLAVLGTATVVAWIVAYQGARINRSGSGPSLARLERFVEDTFTNRPTATQRFQSPSAALLWFEWRTRGLPLVIAAVLLTMVYVVWTSSPLIGADDAPKASEGFIAIATIACAAFGAVIGHRSDKRYMQSFEATRPVSEPQAAFVIIKNSIFAVASSTVICMLGYYLVVARYTVTYAGYYVLNPFTELLPIHPAATAAIVMLLAAIGGWGMMGVVAATVMSGRAATQVAFFIYVVLSFSAFIATQQSLGYQGKEISTHVQCEIQGVAAMIYTVVVLIAAARKDLLSTRATVGLIAGGSLAAVGSAVLFRSSLPLLAAGACMLLVAPPGAFSLALFYNRHR